jgi:hypothetical protein
MDCNLSCSAWIHGGSDLSLCTTHFPNALYKGMCIKVEPLCMYYFKECTYIHKFLCHVICRSAGYYLILRVKVCTTVVCSIQTKPLLFQKGYTIIPRSIMLVSLSKCHALFCRCICLCTILIVILNNPSIVL